MIDVQDEADDLMRTNKQLEAIENKKRVIEKSKERAQSANKDRMGVSLTNQNALQMQQV